MNHFPDDELLSAYLDGELTTEEQATVDRWLAESAEHRQLLEELRSLSQSLESLPRLQLEDDFYQSVLRRAEREMLSSKTSPTDGANSSVDAMVGRVVKDAVAATKPNEEPIAVRRESQDVASEHALQPATTGQRLPWPRGKRPWIYVGLAIAASLLVMLFSPPPLEMQNLKVAQNDRPDRHAEVGDQDQLEAKKGAPVDALGHSELAFKSADHNRPATEGQTSAETYRRKDSAIESSRNAGGMPGAGVGGGGARGLTTTLGREAGEADAKPGTLGDLAGGGTRNDRGSLAAGFGGSANGVADKKSIPGPAGEEMLANGVVVVEVTLTPEALNSDAIRFCLADQQILLEDEIVSLDGTANANRFNLPQSAPGEQKVPEQLNLAPSANPPPGKPSPLSLAGDQPAADLADGATKDGRAKMEAAKAKGDAALAGAAPRPAVAAAMNQAGPGGLAVDKYNFGLIPPSNEVARIEVEAEVQQIAATLAYLHAHPEYFVKVDVRPVPTVKAQQGWSLYNRNLGEQVNEQVKFEVEQREQSQNLYTRDKEAAQQGQHDPKLGVKPNSAKVQDKFADDKGEDKKAEKAAATGSLAPAKPTADLQAADKQVADKPAQALQEQTAAKNRRFAKDEDHNSQPMPTSPASLAKKPADAATAGTAPGANGTVVTHPAAPPVAIAGPDAKQKMPSNGRAERKAGEKELDETNHPPEASGLATDQSAYYYRTLGRARRYNMPYGAAAATNPEPEATPALQQGGAAVASKSPPTDVAKRASIAEPANLAPTNAPAAPSQLPAAPTAGASAPAPTELKSAVETKAQLEDKSKPMPAAESPKVAYEKDQLAKPERAMASSPKLGENRQPVQGKDKGTDAKGAKQGSESLREKESAVKQQLRQPELAIEPTSHSYQRAMIVIRVQQPAPVVTGAPAAAPPAALPAVPAAKR